MPNWTQNICGAPDQVPTWSADGDGMIAIQHCTDDNRHLDARFYPEPAPADRPVGYCGFEELTLIAVFPTLEEAQREMARYAVAIGYYMYAE